MPFTSPRGAAGFPPVLAPSPPPCDEDDAAPPGVGEPAGVETGRQKDNLENTNIRALSLGTETSVSSHKHYQTNPRTGHLITKSEMEKTFFDLDAHTHCAPNFLSVCSPLKARRGRTLRAAACVVGGAFLRLELPVAGSASRLPLGVGGRAPLAAGRWLSGAWLAFRHRWKCVIASRLTLLR